MKYIKLIIAVIVTGIAIYIYSGFFGNPTEKEYSAAIIYREEVKEEYE